MKEPTFVCECETPMYFQLVFLGHVHVVCLSRKSNSVDYI